ncbi:MAG: hypothetical protein V5A34_07750 [Halapricum sp.]
MTDKSLKSGDAPRHTRRAVLGTLAVSSLAGCQSVLNGTETGKTELASVEIVNFHTEPHSVKIRINWDGETELDRTLKLPANNGGDQRAPGAVLNRTWPTVSGQFTVSARKPGTEWSTVSPEDLGYPDCYAVRVIIEKDNKLTIYVSQNQNNCTEGT